MAHLHPGRRGRQGVVATALLGLALLAGCRGDLPDGPELREEVTVYAFEAVGHDPRWLVPQTVDHVSAFPVPEQGEDSVERRVAHAVDALMEHTPAKPFESMWDPRHGCAPGRSVDHVEVGGRVVVVHVTEFNWEEPGSATCDFSAAGYLAHRQQVAWTVRSALGRDVAVRVLMGPDDYESIPLTWPDPAFLHGRDRPAGAGPVRVTFDRTAHVSASPLGDVVIGSRTLGDQTTATCVRRGSTHVGTMAWAVGIDGLDEPAYVVAKYLWQDVRYLRARLPAC